MRATQVLRAVGPRNVAPFVFATDAAEQRRQIETLLSVKDGLAKLGIHGLTSRKLDQMRLGLAAFAEDAALQASVTTASINTPIQFLQNWLTGFIFVITQARKIDNLIGISTAGNWDDEEVVQGVLEQLATAIPYSDTGNVPRSSFNLNWERRTVVRAEEGMGVGVLEEARTARINVNSAENKREAATEALEIFRNTVGFSGFNNGLGRTFGFLNDPNLPAATAFPATGAGGLTTWASKSFLNICADIRGMISDLRNGSGDRIDPATTPMTLALATAAIDYMSTTSDFGISVTEWLSKAYPRVRVESAPELDNAIASSNGCYLYAETVNDKSTDDKRTWAQIVPSKFRLIGVEQKAKGYLEDYSNATAGAFLKRPWAVVRRYGN